MKSLARWCSLAAGALLIAGCNSPGAVLKGKVRLAGKPLAGGSVIVHAGQDQKIRGLIAEDRAASPQSPQTKTPGNNSTCLAQGDRPRTNRIFWA